MKWRETLAAFALLAAQCNGVSATDKYSIGFNETWVTGYLNNLGKYCTNPATEVCPDNFVSADYNSIAYLLFDLATYRHVGTFREVIPINAMLPSAGGSNFDDITKLLGIYSAYNVNLIITIGAPIPTYMSVNGDVFNIMPDDDASWNTLKNNLSVAMIYLVGAMWNSPAISRDWMSTRLFVEGYSEFDGIPNLSGHNYSSTPQRAAQLQSAIQAQLDYYQLPIHTLMPSVVSGGQLPDGSNRGEAEYVRRYYAAGGTGLPNVQLYIPGATTYSQVVYYMDQVLQGIVQAVPQALQGQIVVSETGNSDVTYHYCLANDYVSIDPSQRQYEYAAIASDPYINQNVKMLTFWRLMNIDPQKLRQSENGCEAFFGVVQQSGGYNSVGTNLFSYLLQ